MYKKIENIFMFMTEPSFDGADAVFHGRNGENDQCDRRLGKYVDAVVHKGVGQHRPALPRVFPEKDPAGEHREYIAAENAGQISFDQTVFGAGKNAGQTQKKPKAQQIIQHKLHGEEHIRVD